MSQVDCLGLARWDVAGGASRQGRTQVLGPREAWRAGLGAAEAESGRRERRGGPADGSLREAVQGKALLHPCGKAAVTSVREATVCGSSVAQSVYSLHTCVL